MHIKYVNENTGIQHLLFSGSHIVVKIIFIFGGNASRSGVGLVEIDKDEIAVAVGV